jgi:hypothetical protein
MAIFDGNDWISTRPAAQILNSACDSERVTPDDVRALAKLGVLQSVRVGAGRLFRRADVEALARARASRHKAGTAEGTEPTEVQP